MAAVGQRQAARGGDVRPIERQPCAARGSDRLAAAQQAKAQGADVRRIERPPGSTQSPEAQERQCPPNREAAGAADDGRRIERQPARPTTSAESRGSPRGRRCPPNREAAGAAASSRRGASCECPPNRPHRPSRFHPCLEMADISIPRSLTSCAALVRREDGARPTGWCAGLRVCACRRRCHGTRSRHFSGQCRPRRAREQRRNSASDRRDDSTWHAGAQTPRCVSHRPVHRLESRLQREVELCVCQGSSAGTSRTSIGPPAFNQPFRRSQVDGGATGVAGGPLRWRGCAGASHFGIQR